MITLHVIFKTSLSRKSTTQLTHNHIEYCVVVCIAISALILQTITAQVIL